MNIFAKYFKQNKGCERLLLLPELPFFLKSPHVSKRTFLKHHFHCQAYSQNISAKQYAPWVISCERFSSHLLKVCKKIFPANALIWKIFSASRELSGNKIISEKRRKITPLNFLSFFHPNFQTLPSSLCGACTNISTKPNTTGGGNLTLKLALISMETSQKCFPANALF